jgi:hypothetical protein
VVDSLEEPRSLNRLAVMEATWEHHAAFDSQQRYRCVPSRELRFGRLQKLLAHSFDNPTTDITLRWEPAGSYALSESSLQ